MTTYAAVALAALWSVTFGYEPSADAEVGYDYIVQVEPEMLEAMKRGELPPIEANLPPEVTPVRRVRIVVGKEELPKKLRPPAKRTTMRPDIDADSSAVLLAQTGPAGVYGRTPTGFQNAPAGTSPASATTTATQPAATVPPPSTRYQPFGYTNPATGNPTAGAGTTGAGTWSNGPAVGATGAPSVNAQQPGVVDHLGQAGDNLRGVVNNVGQAGQQVLDTTRQVLGETITPPEYTGYDPQGRPLSNIADRLQSEVRNTAQAFRDPWDRPATSPTANHVPNPTTGPAQNAQQRAPDSWATTASNPTGAASGGAQPGVSNQPTYPAANYRNDRYAQEQSVLDRGQGGTATGNIQPPLLEAPSVNSNAPQYAPTQNRNPVDLNNWAGTRENPTTQPNTQVANDPSRGFESGTPNINSQQPGLSIPRGNDWQGNAGGVAQNNQNPSTPATNVSNPPSLSPPEVTSDGRSNPQSPAANRGQDLVDFRTGGNTSGDQLDQQAGVTQGAGGGSTTVLNVLAWMVAAGSVAGNLFQWGSIVDLRNKYRVALRRNSPGFGRSMAA